MIKITVLYPNSDDAKFDMDYYLDSHIPMVQSKCGSALLGVSVDQGLGGRAPGEPAPYVTIAHLLFDSVESFQASFAPNAGEFRADIPNFTNISAPVLQVSEVKL